MTSWPVRRRPMSRPGWTRRGCRPDLGALAAALPSPAPLPLVIPHLEATSPDQRVPGSRRVGADRERGGDGGGVTSTSTSSTAIGAPLVAGAPVGTKAGPGEIFDAEPYPGGRGRRRGGGGGAGPGPVTDLPGRASRRRTWWIVAAIALAVIVAGGLVAAFEAKVFTPSHPTPTLINLPLAQARADVAKVHMTLALGAPVKSITVGAGDVVSQSPKPGTSLKEGSTVNVVLSGGKPNVSVPSLANMTCAQAAAALQAAHFQSVCAPGRLQRHHPGRRARPVVHRCHAEPLEGALRQHHHARALTGSLAGDRAEHPAELHVRPGAGRTPGGGTRPRRRTRCPVRRCRRAM